MSEEKKPKYNTSTIARRKKMIEVVILLRCIEIKENAPLVNKNMKKKVIIRVLTHQNPEIVTRISETITHFGPRTWPKILK